MQNTARSSPYEELTLTRDGESVRLLGRTVNFSYYESLLSPYITANLTYVDTGNAIQGNTDTQERLGTILRSLPIEGRGKETLKFKISNTLGTLDFTSSPLRVSKPLPLGQESFREFVNLSLVSDAAIQNENGQIYEKYYNNIGNSVTSILTNKLKIPANKIILDQTQNSLAFTGVGRRPFDVIIACAKQAIPVEGAPGFLFWENQSGFNFRSIDSLISADPVNANNPYRYYGVAKTSTSQTDNYRILSSPSYSQNEDLIKALRTGIYRTKNIGFNPYSFKYEELYMTVDKSGIKTLGAKPEFDEKFANSFTRTFQFVLDPGNNESGISNKVNNNQLEYHAKAAIRYNLFMAQIMDITVPCNPSLRAGDKIKCTFEKITTSNKNEGATEDHQDGDYIILNLCHYFTPKRSFTALTVVRDTFGNIYK